MEGLKQDVENKLSSRLCQEQGEGMAQKERQDAPQKLRLSEWEIRRVSAGQQRLKKQRACKAPAFRAGKRNKSSAREVCLISFFFPCGLNFVLFGKIWIRPEQRKRPDVPPDTPADDRARLKESGSRHISRMGCTTGGEAKQQRQGRWGRELQ